MLRAVYLDGDLLVHHRSFRASPGRAEVEGPGVYLLVRCPPRSRPRRTYSYSGAAGMLFVTTDATQDARHWIFRCAAITCSVETPVWPPMHASKISTRTRPEHNHASAHPDQNGPKYVDPRQPAISTSSVRGPCTPSTLSSSMSEVADGPEIKVMALPSPLTAFSRPAKASGTRPTICCSRTTHRW
jgi:hypothetical protein